MSLEYRSTIYLQS